MELGALVCKPQNPLCRQCPFKRICLAFKKDLTGTLPYKSPPAPRKQLNHLVFVIRRGDHFYLQQRPQRGLLAGLWEFPYLQVRNLELNTEEVQELFEATYKTTCRLDGETPLLSHQYSHIHLSYRAIFFHIKSRNTKSFSQGKWLKAEEISLWPIHAAHKKILDLLKNQYDKPSEK